MLAGQPQRAPSQAKAETRVIRLAVVKRISEDLARVEREPPTDPQAQLDALRSRTQSIESSIATPLCTCPLTTSSVPCACVNKCSLPAHTRRALDHRAPLQKCRRSTS